MRWLAGLAAVVAGLLALLFWARASWRASVRQRLLAILKQKHPEIEVVSERSAQIELRLPDGSTGTLMLDNLYSGLAAGASDAEAQGEAIAAFVAGVLSQHAESMKPLSLAEHSGRLLPRLVPEGFAREAATPDPIPASASGIPGLETVYVLDGDASVMYLTESRLAELGLGLPELHALALENLRLNFPALVVRGVVEKGTVNMLKVGDSFDATRLLLVPGCLEEGEALAAVVPDRETLGLLPIPPDGDWEPIRRLARTPASPYAVLDRPVRVTREGFTVV